MKVELEKKENEKGKVAFRKGKKVLSVKGKKGKGKGGDKEGKEEIRKETLPSAERLPSLISEDR